MPISIGLFFLIWLIAGKGYGWIAMESLPSLLTVLGVALVCVLPFLSENPASLQIRPKIIPAWLRFCGGLIVLVAVHRMLLQDIREWPIEPQYADMLPLLKAGFADVDRLMSPYRPHNVPWTLYNYYLSTTFFPYYLFYKLNIDIRYMTLLCWDLIGLASLLLIVRGQGGLAGISSFVYWVLGFIAISFTVHQENLFAIIQLGPFWLWTTLAFLFLITNHLRWSAFFFTLSLASREDAVIYSLIPAIAFWKFAARGKRIVLSVVGGVVLLHLPFLIADPFFYLGNLKQYESLGFVIENTPNRFVGVSRYLYEQGLSSLRWPLFVILLSVVIVRYGLTSRTWQVAEIVRYSISASLLFCLFAMVSWEYLYIAPLIMAFLYMFSIQLSRSTV